MWTRSPPVIRPPAARASASAVCWPSNDAASISGPTKVPVCADRRRRRSRRPPSGAAGRRRRRCRGRTGGAASCSAGRRCPWRRRRRRAASGPGRRSGATMAALLPPSSSSARAKRAASLGADGAAHGGRAGGRDQRDLGMVDQRLADLAAADDHRGQARRARRRTSPRRARTAPGRPARSAGSSPTASRPRRRRRPSASAAFHDQTATGKLKAEITPDHAERVPGLHHPVLGPLGGDGQAEQLARQADGEVADVDHLLHLAGGLGDDLAGLQRHQRGRGRPWRRAAPRPAAGPVRPGAARAPCARPGRPRARPRQPGRWRRGEVSCTSAMTSPVTGERTARPPPVHRAAGTPSRRSTS